MLTVTLQPEYNTVLKDADFTGFSKKFSPIKIDSTLTKTQIDSFKFVSMKSSARNTCVEIVNTLGILVSNSVFTKNKGKFANDFYFRDYSKGTVIFRNSVITGFGKAYYSTIDYTEKPSMFVFNSKNIAFEGCTFQDIANVATGAAIHVKKSTFSVSGSTFKNNHARLGK